MFSVLDYRVHGLQGGWGEERFAALGADIGGDVAEEREFALPAMDVLDATGGRMEAVAEWAVYRGGMGGFLARCSGEYGFAEAVEHSRQAGLALLRCTDSVVDSGPATFQLCNATL